MVDADLFNFVKRYDTVFHDEQTLKTFLHYYWCILHHNVLNGKQLLPIMGILPIFVDNFSGQNSKFMKFII